MIRALVLVVFGAMILGTSCPGDFCANSLSSTDFRFSLTVPSEFECSTVFPNSTVLAQGRWYDSLTGRIASVVVKTASTDGGPDQVANCQEKCPGTEPDGCYTIEDVGQVTNGNGITFDLKKVTFLDQDTCKAEVFSYIAAATMPSGNGLFITVAALTDDTTLQPTLNTIVQSVQWLP